MEDQDEFIIRKSGNEEVALEANNNKAAVLEDIGHKTQTCISPIKSTMRKIRRLTSAKFLTAPKCGVL